MHAQQRQPTPGRHFRLHSEYPGAGTGVPTGTFKEVPWLLDFLGSKPACKGTPCGRIRGQVIVQSWMERSFTGHR